MEHKLWHGGLFNEGKFTWPKVIPVPVAACVAGKRGSRVRLVTPRGTGKGARVMIKVSITVIVRDSWRTSQVRGQIDMKRRTWELGPHFARETIGSEGWENAELQ